MRLAFVLFTWFPHGGLQQDLVKVVQACRERGVSDITIFCMAWDGEQLTGVDTTIVAVAGWSATAKRAAFARYVEREVAGKFDKVIGFNRMPCLDYYYAADLCFAAKARGRRGPWYRLLPRTRQYLAFEDAVFGAHARTTSLLLSPMQRVQYKAYYATPNARLVDLPPGIKREHRAGPDAAELRRSFRAEHGITDDELVVLQVGSSFRTKGVPRSLLALAALPADLKQRVRFFLVGRDDAAPWMKRAEAVGLGGHVQIVGAFGGIPRFMQGADVLLHPSLAESAGMVLLEAVVAGLPVLTTASCGYAFHVEQAQAGLVCPEPFNQDVLNLALVSMLRADRSAWRANGIRYGQQNDLYDMPQRVASLLVDEVRR
ncbi:MAG TPA: glycosyltransferase family 4 protein [Pseudomonadales bacterium]